MGKSFLRKYFLPYLVWLFYKMVQWTWRLKLTEALEMQERYKEKKSVALAHWHGDEIALLGLIKRYNLAIMTSTSKDGESMNTLVQLAGAVTVRGSSTRGGVQGLKGLIRLVKSGKSTAIAVDGPKGPIYEVKPGIFEISKLCGVPIFSAGVICDRAWKFSKSWNQTYFPKPFAKVSIVWKGPIFISKDFDPRDPKVSQNLKEMLDAARHEAIKQFTLTEVKS